MGEVLSARKFAELVGRSNVYISRKVKEGVLPTDESGKILKEEGLAAFHALGVLGYEANRENAEKARAASKKIAASAGKKPASSKKQGEDNAQQAQPAIKKTVAAPAVQQKIDLPEDDEAALLLLHEGKLSRAQTGSLYDRWKAKEKHVQMLQRELEYQKSQGRLFDQTDVEADARATATGLIEKLRSLPPRVAPLCEGKPAREIEGLMDEAINKALGELQKSKFARGAAVEG